MFQFLTKKRHKSHASVEVLQILNEIANTPTLNFRVKQDLNSKWSPFVCVCVTRVQFMNHNDI